jgi:hypothetical protein
MVDFSLPGFSVSHHETETGGGGRLCAQYCNRDLPVTRGAGSHPVLTYCRMCADKRTPFSSQG